MSSLEYDPRIPFIFREESPAEETALPPPFPASFLLKQLKAANLMSPRWTEFHTDLAIKPYFITSHHRHLKQIFDIVKEIIEDALRSLVGIFLFFHRISTYPRIEN